MLLSGASQIIRVDKLAHIGSHHRRMNEVNGLHTILRRHRRGRVRAQTEDELIEA